MTSRKIAADEKRNAVELLLFIAQCPHGICALPGTPGTSLTKKPRPARAPICRERKLITAKFPLVDLPMRKLLSAYSVLFLQHFSVAHRTCRNHRSSAVVSEVFRGLQHFYTRQHEHYRSQVIQRVNPLRYRPSTSGT
jgi:hypothetical protein